MKKSSTVVSLPFRGTVTEFDCAVPDQFVTAEDVEWHRNEGEDFSGKPIDPDNPPTYESQASYLDRLNLLSPGERRRLRKKDFKPEIVSFPALTRWEAK